jgi:hypothetical protein
MSAPRNSAADEQAALRAGPASFRVKQNQGE